METAFPLDEAIARVAVPSARNRLLMRPLFRNWTSTDRVLPPDCLLWSDPPVVESGLWSVDDLVPMKSKEFLEATAGLFEPSGATPISIMQPGFWSSPSAARGIRRRATGPSRAISESALQAS